MFDNEAPENDCSTSRDKEPITIDELAEMSKNMIEDDSDLDDTVPVTTPKKTNVLITILNVVFFVAWIFALGMALLLLIIMPRFTIEWWVVMTAVFVTVLSAWRER